MRERTLQGEEPEVKIIAYWHAPREEEKKLQEMFRDKRKRGEWFNLNAIDLIKIKEYMQKYE